MNWQSAGEFFAMGGYGLYVWGAYGATAACMFAEPLLVALRHAQAQRALSSAGDEGAA